MSSVGGGQARARFLLEDEEDFVEAAVASASVAFSGLTMLGFIQLWYVDGQTIS